MYILFAKEGRNLLMLADFYDAYLQNITKFQNKNLEEWNEERINLEKEFFPLDPKDETTSLKKFLDKIAFHTYCEKNIFALLHEMLHEPDTHNKNLRRPTTYPLHFIIDKKEFFLQEIAIESIKKAATMMSIIMTHNPGIITLLKRYLHCHNPEVNFDAIQDKLQDKKKQPLEEILLSIPYRNNDSMRDKISTFVDEFRKCMKQHRKMCTIAKALIIPPVTNEPRGYPLSNNALAYYQRANRLLIEALKIAKKDCFITLAEIKTLSENMLRNCPRVTLTMNALENEIVGLQKFSFRHLFESKADALTALNLLMDQLAHIDITQNKEDCNVNIESLIRATINSPALTPERFSALKASLLKKINPLEEGELPDISPSNTNPRGLTSQ